MPSNLKLCEKMEIENAIKQFLEENRDKESPGIVPGALLAQVYDRNAFRVSAVAVVEGSYTPNEFKIVANDGGRIIIETLEGSVLTPEKVKKVTKADSVAARLLDGNPWLPTQLARDGYKDHLTIVDVPIPTEYKDISYASFNFEVKKKRGGGIEMGIRVEQRIQCTCLTMGEVTERLNEGTLVPISMHSEIAAEYMELRET